MLFYQGEFCAMLYSNDDLKNWLPVLADTPIGFAGMHYLGVDGLQAAYDHIAQHTEIVKPLSEDHTGVRLFYFRDIDGYVIGVNESPPSTSADPHRTRGRMVRPSDGRPGAGAGAAWQRRTGH
ncbi:hypothetical protein WEB32_28385 [Streptomyces netropsis]|uniref:VOC family protein n=1 Tax=Streptomyces netropsis TaxID=55404 RepID=UPI0030D00017